MNVSDYYTVQNMIARQTVVVDITSFKYPIPTIRSGRWIISAPENSNIKLTFIDFRITYGTPFLIGRGSSFKATSNLINLGSPDINMKENDTLVIRTSTIWIMFSTDTVVSEQEALEIEEHSGVMKKIKPIVDGFWIKVEAQVEGICNIWFCVFDVLELPSIK